MRILFLFCAMTISAMTSGNLFSPSLLSEGFFISDESVVNFRLGFEGDGLINKKMKKDHTLKEIDLSDARWKGRMNTMVFTFNVKERLDLFAQGGTAKWKVDFCHDGRRYKGESKDRWAYKVVAKLMVIEAKDTGFGVDVMYLESLAKAAYFLENGVLLADVPNFRVRQWQITAGISQRIKYFVPYFGVTYIGSKLKLKPFSSIAERPIRLEQRLRVGIVFGTSLTVGSFFYLNLELRAINETAAAVTAQARF